MTYPVLFRRKILSVREKEDLVIAQVAKHLCAGIASVARWIKTPDSRAIRNKPSTKINMEVLAQDIEDHPDAYQYERAKRPGVSTQGINHALRRLGVTYENSAPPKGQRRRVAHLPGKN